MCELGNNTGPGLLQAAESKYTEIELEVQ